MLSLRFLKLHWFILSILLLSLIHQQTHASVHAHPADGNIDKVRDTARALGKPYLHSICGLAIKTKDGQRFTASGFLVHKPATGFAIIVTTAHDFYDEEERKWYDLESVQVSFSGRVDFTSPIRASRLDIRDGFLMDPSTAKCVNDIAILEVPVELLPPSCVTMKLYTGVGYTKPLIKSFHAGYGRFCTTETPYDAGLTQLYGGHTIVTYASLYDNSYFITYLASKYHKPADLRASPERIDHFEPSITAEVRIGTTTLSREEEIKKGILQLYKAHEDQSLLGQGGSGSPLLFSTKEGMKVAGIYSRILVQPPKIRLPGDRFCLSACYEPIMKHIDWVMAGSGESESTASTSAAGGGGAGAGVGASGGAAGGAGAGVGASVGAATAAPVTTSSTRSERPASKTYIFS